MYDIVASRIILLVALSNCEQPYKRRLHMVLEFIPSLSKAGISESWPKRFALIEPNLG